MNVTWLEDALDQLANLYVTLDLNGQRMLAEVVDLINATLRIDPASQGESRDQVRRLWFAGPLQVLFRVVSAREVEVLEVGWASPRR